jgi:hypothetical protein
VALVISCRYLTAVALAVSCRYLTAVALAVSCRYLNAVALAVSCRYLTAVVLTVSCRDLTAAARFQSQVRPCGISGRRSGARTGFVRLLRVSSVSTTVPTKMGVKGKLCDSFDGNF